VSTEGIAGEELVELDADHDQPALAAVLALGLIAEAWLRINRRRATSVWNPHRFRGERHAALAARPGPGLATADLPQGSES
jgi:hypothetical protein